MIITKGWDLLKLSLSDPTGALERLRALNLTSGERWMAVALAAVISTLLARGAEAFFPVDISGPMAMLHDLPIMLAAVQFGAAVLAAGLIAGVGRAFGGTGNFDDALLMLAWVEAVIVALQVVQLVVAILFPLSAAILTLVAFGLYVYLLVRLTTALHGFTNPFLVGIAMVGALFFLGSILGLLLSIFGLTPPMLEATP